MPISEIVDSDVIGSGGVGHVHLYQVVPSLEVHEPQQFLMVIMVLAVEVNLELDEGGVQLRL